MPNKFHPTLGHSIIITTKIFRLKKKKKNLLFPLYVNSTFLYNHFVEQNPNAKIHMNKK